MIFNRFHIHLFIIWVVNCLQAFLRWLCLWFECARISTMLLLLALNRPCPFLSFPRALLASLIKVSLWPNLVRSISLMFKSIRLGAQFRLQVFFLLLHFLELFILRPSVFVRRPGVATLLPSVIMKLLPPWLDLRYFARRCFATWIRKLLIVFFQFA